MLGGIKHLLDLIQGHHGPMPRAISTSNYFIALAKEAARVHQRRPFFPRVYISPCTKLEKDRAAGQQGGFELAKTRQPGSFCTPL
jgi:hypothetical protein